MESVFIKACLLHIEIGKLSQKKKALLWIFLKLWTEPEALFHRTQFLPERPIYRQTMIIQIWAFGWQSLKNEKQMSLSQ